MSDQSSHTLAAPPVKFRLLYAACFYSAVAGGLGALSGWAALKALHVEGIKFTGLIKSVDPKDYGRSSLYLGCLHVAGVKVCLAPGTRIQKAGSVASMTLEQLTPGSAVTVRGERVGPSRNNYFVRHGLLDVTDSQFLEAEDIRVEPAGATATSQVNLEDLGLRAEDLRAVLNILPVVGVLLLSLAWMWTTVLAFKESFRWGLACVLLNPLPLISLWVWTSIPFPHGPELAAYWVGYLGAWLPLNPVAVWYAITRRHTWFYTRATAPTTPLSIL